jgi:hypothetical protein
MTLAWPESESASSCVSLEFLHEHRTLARVQPLAGIPGYWNAPAASHVRACGQSGWHAPERHVLGLVGERTHNIADRGEALVDVLCLLQPVALRLRAPDALAACEVHQVQAPVRCDLCHRVVPIHDHRQHGVRA